jgi:hypothetical protein
VFADWAARVQKKYQKEMSTYYPIQTGGVRIRKTQPLQNCMYLIKSAVMLAEIY